MNINRLDKPVPDYNAETDEYSETLIPIYYFSDTHGIIHQSETLIDFLPYNGDVFYILKMDEDNFSILKTIYSNVVDNVPYNKIMKTLNV